MNRPLVLLVDDTAAVLEARALADELLRTGCRNGLVVRSETRRPLWQHPTPGVLEDAADQQ
ncbi:hypothetical protein AB0K89_26520 [Streptomyces cinnamoneus]|uniref:hypothetical protein n=1 Tax=Streptomyces cinnamoneus TaxID=53446 RepID=UPI00342591A5